MSQNRLGLFFVFEEDKRKQLHPTNHKKDARASQLSNGAFGGGRAAETKELWAIWCRGM